MPKLFLRFTLLVLLLVVMLVVVVMILVVLVNVGAQRAIVNL